MTFYINSENQKLLWNTISNTAIFINIFGSHNKALLSDASLTRELLSRNRYTMRDGEEWFRIAIQQIYKANKNIKYDQLQQLNKITISYMVNELKIMLQNMSSPIVNDIPVNNNVLSNINNLQPQVITPEKKTDISAFEKRQQEYESMFKRPPPPEVNFLEKNQIEDKSNVDERLKKHIEDREAELSKYAVGKPTPPSTLESVTFTNNDPLQFLKPISAPSIPIASNEIISEITDMRKMMNNIEMEMKQILEEFKNIKKTITPQKEITVSPVTTSNEVVAEED